MEAPTACMMTVMNGEAEQEILIITISRTRKHERERERERELSQCENPQDMEKPPPK